jgi:hypothetical protein
MANALSRTPIANYPCTVFSGNGGLGRATSASLQTLGTGSFLCRVKLHTTQSSVGLLHCGTSSEQYRELVGINADNGLKWGTWCGLNNGWQGAIANATVVKDVWYDILATWVFPGNTIIYTCRPAAADVTATKATTAAASFTAAMKICGNATGTSYRFSGCLRDVMLLSRVITPEEWTAYKAGTKPTGNVVADWPLYPDWLDDSGNTNTLTSAGIAPTFNPRALTRAGLAVSR